MGVTRAASRRFRVMPHRTGLRHDPPMQTRSKFQLQHTADPCPDQPVERGPAAEGVGWWVPQTKHTLLAKYISATRKAQLKFPHRVLIDPFCGPGRIQVRGESITRDGGSMVAWRQSVSSGCPFTSVMVGDIDSASDLLWLIRASHSWRTARFGIG